MWEWSAYGGTDRGLVRPTNQDTFLVDNRHRLWAVADGMGGHAGGDIASRLVMDTLADLAPSLAHNPSDPTAMEEDVADHLTTMVQRAHRAVQQHAVQHPPLQGMGTTLVLAHLLPFPPPRLIVLNVGDSRAYLIREAAIRQVTRDHTLVEEQVRDGLLTPAQAACHPDRHVLTRAMGFGLGIEADRFHCELLDRDLLLLCSDGLTKMLTDEHILRTTMQHRHDPAGVTHALIQAALDEGGIDNVTVVACTVTGTTDATNRQSGK